MAKAKRVQYSRKGAWAGRRVNLRRRVVAALRDIETGEITELDLARLHNFCMCSLMLLSKVEAPVWESAIRAAETAALIRGEVDDIEPEDIKDFDVILDSSLLHTPGA